VAHLVIADDFTLLWIEQTIAFFEAGDHAFDRVAKIVHWYRVAAPPRRQECRLVDEIRQIRAGKAWRERRDLIWIKIAPELGRFDVDPNNISASFFVGSVDQDLAVKASGA
jgi:hypothetical protein